MFFISPVPPVAIHATHIVGRHAVRSQFFTAIVILESLQSQRVMAQKPIVLSQYGICPVAMMYANQYIESIPRSKAFMVNMASSTIFGGRSLVRPMMRGQQLFRSPSTLSHRYSASRIS
mgnify:CR=1 FL=1